MKNNENKRNEKGDKAAAMFGKKKRTYFGEIRRAVRFPDSDRTSKEKENTGEVLNRLLRLLDLLPNRLRLILVLRLRDGLDFEKIGKAAEIPTFAAQNLYSTALRRLGRAILEKRRRKGRQ